MLQFLAGMAVGGLVGITVMCVVQINNLNETRDEFRKEMKQRDGSKKR